MKRIQLILFCATLFTQALGNGEGNFSGDGIPVLINVEPNDFGYSEINPNLDFIPCAVAVDFVSKIISYDLNSSECSEN